MPEIELISDLNVRDAEGITPDGITLVYKTNYTEFDDGGGSWRVLQVIWNSGVGPSLVAAFLYDIIKKLAEKRPHKHPKRIQIDRNWVDFEAGQIQRRIEESVNIDVFITTIHQSKWPTSFAPSASTASITTAPKRTSLVLPLLLRAVLLEG